MALQGSGRAGSARVPIRGFAKLLSNLPATTRNRVESAFTDAEDLLNFHNLSNPDQINRRSFDGLVQAPIITATRSILGGSVEWERVNDPRIAMYEVQVDPVNVFPNPDSFNVYEPFFAIEKIDSARFIRVRSVTQDGRTGNFSNTAVINPITTAPRAQTFIFYPEYSDESIQRSLPGLAQSSAGETVLDLVNTYSGQEKLPNEFYTVFEKDFFPEDNRIDGGMLCWGYISSRMKEFLPNSLIRPWDRIRFKVNGYSRMEHIGQLCDDGWSMYRGLSGVDAGNVLPTTFGDRFAGTIGQFSEIPAFVGDADSPMSFYTRGGYTVALGPWLEPFENLAKRRGQGPKDPHSITQTGAGISWTQLNNAKVPDPPDFDACVAFAFVGAIVAFGAGGGLTKTLKFQDFKFDIPLDATITGIKVWIRRFAAISTVSVDDVTVQLLDENDTGVGENKADSDFPWFANSDFGTVESRAPVGYQTFGGTEVGGDSDLWYTNWYPSQINSPNFGFQMQALGGTSFFGSSAGLPHAQVAVSYDEFYSNKRLRLSIDVMPLSNFYLQREVFGACFNVIELGQKEDAVVIVGDDPC